MSIIKKILTAGLVFPMLVTAGSGFCMANAAEPGDAAVTEETSVEEVTAETADEDGDADDTQFELELEQLLGGTIQDGDSCTRTLLQDTNADGQIVVAIDPGHDSTHAGANYTWNGVTYYEEKLTLKIAEYCKEELEQYQGVQVLLTREDAACPYPSESASADDIGQRILAAVAQGADYFVSIHLNASTSSSPYGAEVYYPNTNYCTSDTNSNVAEGRNVSTEGKALADSILTQLSSLGLYNRGAQIVMTGTGDTYDDGSLADMYAVVRRSKKSGIPGIIVEHCFLSNSSDCLTYLSSDAKLQKLGVADATGIANYLGLSKTGTTVTPTDPTDTTTDPTDPTTDPTDTTTDPETPAVTDAETYDANSSEGTVYTIQVSGTLNVRSGPATTYTRLGSLSNGDEIIIYKTEDEWGQFLYNGQTAWVKLSYTQQQDATVKRLYGSNRYGTAIAAANQLLADSGNTSFDTIVLAYADNFPDALAGSTLAYLKGAPILLAGSSTSGTENTLAYISEKLTAGGTVYLLGGTSAVSADVEQTLTDGGYDVIRLGGATRYETNLMIAEELNAAEGGTVFITSGLGYADSLSISGVAARQNAPILLADESGLSQLELDYIASISPEKIYIIGGTSAVTADVETQLSAYSVERVAGGNRYQTAVAIADTFGLSASSDVILASGVNFPDGLVAGVLAAEKNLPLLLTPNSANSTVKTWLAAQETASATVMGGQLAISDSTAAALLP